MYLQPVLSDHLTQRPNYSSVQQQHLHHTSKHFALMNPVLFQLSKSLHSKFYISTNISVISRTKSLTLELSLFTFLGVWSQVFEQINNEKVLWQSCHCTLSHLKLCEDEITAYICILAFLKSTMSVLSSITENGSSQFLGTFTTKCCKNAPISLHLERYVQTWILSSAVLFLDCWDTVSK